MKHLLEFATFKDSAKSMNPKFNKIINQEFQDDEPLITNVNIEDINKDVKLDWHDSYSHPIVDRIKSRTSINSVSHFNDIVEYGINYVFPYEIGKSIIDGGRYAFHFNNHNFYLIVSLNYKNLFDDDTMLKIITIATITNDEIVEIYDD